MRKSLLIGALILCVGTAFAQETCPTIVQEALEFADQECTATDRNQACYGNIDLEAYPQKDVTQFEFDSRGDITDVTDINTLNLHPMDETAGEWGLVVMNLQADIPDSMPGQNVTFILFGDVSIENRPQADLTPMQAFYLTTGIGTSNCAEAPEDGLMVQTPSGVKEVSFNINGIDVEMGSTVFFQAIPGNEMNVKTVEGKARIKVNDKIVNVVQGSEYTAPINEDLEITEEGELTPYEEEEVNNLPTDLLDREIEIADPLTEEEIEDVKRRTEAGEPLCSDESESYLPPCTRPLIDAYGNEVQYDADGNPILFDSRGNPLFYDETGQPIWNIDAFERYLEYWNDPDPSDDFGVDLEDKPEARPTTERPRVVIVTPTFTPTATPTFTSTPEPTFTPTPEPTYTPEPPSVPKPRPTNPPNPQPTEEASPEVSPEATTPL